MSLKTIAEKTFLSSPAVSARIEKLEKDGLYVMGVGDFTGEVQKTTTIYVRRKKWGRYLKDYFKNPTIQEADALTNGADVEIVLGTEDALN